MNKILKNPLNESEEEMDVFISAFLDNRYEIVTTPPSVDNIPESLIGSYKNISTYRKMLNDDGAYFHFFSIRYSGREEEPVIVPVGLYGVSKNRRTYFPLLLNGFWQKFVMSTKESFREVSNIVEDKDCDFYYSRLVDLKREFIHNIFKYYRTIDTEYCSAMAWPIRGVKSNTRSIAESLSFYRNEDQEFEIYSSIKIDSNQWQYLKDCVVRWGILVDGSQQESSNATYQAHRLYSFVRSMVGYENFESSYRNLYK